MNDKPTIEEIEKRLENGEDIEIGPDGEIRPRTPPPPEPEHRLNLSRPLAVLDTEWHIGSLKTARVVQLAIRVLGVDGDATDHCWLVKPPEPIDDLTTEVHGITNEDVAESPEFPDIAREVLDLLEGCDICGYNVRADVEVLDREFESAELEFSMEGRFIVDPMRLWQKREPRNLAAAYERFVGELPEDLKAHDAMDDVVMTLRIAEKFAGNASPQELHDEAHPDMVDSAGKFRRLESGQIVFNFGKHRNRLVGQHPDYLEWMVYKGGGFSSETIRYANEFLDEIEAERRAHAEQNAGNEEADDGIPF